MRGSRLESDVHRLRTTLTTSGCYIHRVFAKPNGAVFHNSVTNHLTRYTLPPDQVAAISTYLTANAGRGDSNLSRITDQRWWQHEHRRNAADWTRPEVKAKSNCRACHKEADKGLYDDD